MEEKTQARKGHFWLGLSVGLLIGILLACGFYFLDKYTALEMLRFQRANTESAVTDTVVQIVETPVRTKKTPVKNDTLAQNVTETPADTTHTEETDDFVEYDTDDLMLDLDEGAKPVVKAKGIASRRIRVANYCSVAGMDPEYDYFDVEQWSEPVKNRISYQRKGNVLKIRGIDINTIEIGWMPEGYILRTNGWNENSRTYPIPENAEFTRLSE